MSIVERALEKLQKAGASPAAPATRAPAAPSSPIGRVVSIEPPVSAPRAVRTDKTLQVDLDALRHAGLMAPEHQQRELAHQYRTLKRPLIKHAFDPASRPEGARAGSPRCIMVSSALPGEGKTFTSINLALSLSLERDHTVLLVDGDVAKPHVSRIFGVEDEPGLLDVLADPSIPVHSVVLPTSVKGLCILPVGRRSEVATEFLASARMRQAIQQLEQIDPAGLVVVDSPPILLTSEARVLASLFGQVVLVVLAGTTPQQAVTDALGMIGEGPRVGLVLNQAAHDELGGRYYGYGDYYGDAQAERRSESLAPPAAAVAGERP